MRTGLQRHIERSTPRGLAGTSQRLGLSMRPSARLRPATADDNASGTGKDAAGDGDQEPPEPPSGGRPSLKRIK